MAGLLLTCEWGKRMSVHNNFIPKTVRRGKAASAKSVDEPNKVFHSDLKIMYDFRNGFPFTVNIIQRSGLAVGVPTTTPVELDCPDFVIRVTYSVTSRCKLFADNVAFEHNHHANEETSALRQAVKRVSPRILQQNVYEFAIEYKITREQFKNCDYSIEIDELDIVLTRDDPSTICHSRSEVGRGLAFEQKADPFSFAFNILINDPKHKYGTRFINIAGKVYEVHVKDDPTREEGVYLTTLKDISDCDLLESKCFIKRYNFNEADKALGLYRTRDEAEAVGNLELERKRMLEEAQHERAIEKNRLEGDFIERKRKLDMDFMEKDHELKQREHRLKEEEAKRDALMAELKDATDRMKLMREQEMTKYKDYYEMRSMDRKDSSEFVKWIPVIFTGAAILFAKLI